MSRWSQPIPPGSAAVLPTPRCAGRWNYPPPCTANVRPCCTRRRPAALSTSAWDTGSSRTTPLSWRNGSSPSTDRSARVFFGRTSQAVVCVCTARPGANCRLHGGCPSFGQQYFSVVPRQVDDVAYATIGQVDTVDDLGQLLGQPNLHTHSHLDERPARLCRSGAVRFCPRHEGFVSRLFPVHGWK